MCNSIAAVVMALGAATALAFADDLASRISATPGLVDVTSLDPRIQVELKYSTADNFLGKDVYGSLDRCFLNRTAAAMLARAAQLLAAKQPQLRLRVHDCVRPLAVQRQMWALVVGTRQQTYVGDPHSPDRSLHNYGCAVDLTLADGKGKPVDMGTAFGGTFAPFRTDISVWLPHLVRQLHWDCGGDSAISAEINEPSEVQAVFGAAVSGPDTSIVGAGRGASRRGTAAESTHGGA
jgi:D-alanyl-D-alanine dipeptidase